jgi:tubulin polyglutamylase TTLL6/13
MCFEILGFDVMIDAKLKPWLIEINYTPSFTTDTPLDYIIKKGVVDESLRIMNVSYKNKIKWLAKEKMRIAKRVLCGKKKMITPEQRQHKKD